MEENKELNVEELEKVTGGFIVVETTNHKELGKGYWYCINYYLFDVNRKFEKKEGGFLDKETRDSRMSREILTIHSANRGNIHFDDVEKGCNK